MKNKWKKLISIVVLLITTLLGIMHQAKGGGPEGTPSVDALCAFGGIETLYLLITTGEYIKKIEPSSLILLAAILILTIIVGRSFCGYVCPLGTLQDIFTTLSQKLKIKQIKLDKKLDKVLRNFKYAVLFLVLFLTYRAGELIIRSYDPWVAYMHLSSGSEVFGETLMGFIILLLVLVSALFIERAWCRYICPLGAALSLVAPVSMFKVRRTVDTCIGCKRCNRNCPVGLEVSSSQIPTRTECISCGSCISSCPVEKTMEIKSKNRAVTLDRYAVYIILIMILIVGSNIALGTFRTAQTNSEVLIKNGEKNPDNIKGYMSIKDVSEEFNIGIDVLLEKCNLSMDIDINKSLKEITKEYNEKGIDFETDTVREMVREIINE
jgi:NapH/MauN family ferredoxin-type protein